MKRIEEIMQQAEITAFPWDDVREQVKFEDGFIEGAKWADSNPNPEIIKRVLLYALQRTNILLVNDWDEVRWNLLIKKAMEE